MKKFRKSLISIVLIVTFALSTATASACITIETGKDKAYLNRNLIVRSEYGEDIYLVRGEKIKVLSSHDGIILAENFKGQFLLREKSVNWQKPRIYFTQKECDLTICIPKGTRLYTAPAKGKKFMTAHEDLSIAAYSQTRNWYSLKYRNRIVFVRKDCPGLGALTAPICMVGPYLIEPPLPGEAK